MGLAISEKMRWQIRGLNRGSNNAQEGISLIQTADGALHEIHDVLQRRNELAIQAANDTNCADDRDVIQKEINQLKSEINRVSRTTTFNTRTVLMAEQLININADDFSAVQMNDTFTGMGNRGNGIVYGKAIDFSKINELNKEELIGKRFWVTCSDYCSQIFSFTFTDNQGVSPTFNNTSLYVDIGVKDTNIKSGMDIVDAIYDTVVANQSQFTPNGYGTILIGHANGLSKSNGSLIFYSTYNPPPYMPGMGLIRATDMLVKEEELKLQVGARPYVELAIEIRTINSATLGLGDFEVGSHEKAGRCIDLVKNAINIVSDYRSYLGALPNRLTHTITNNDNNAENSQSAESRLRDTDMADELVGYARNSILEQIGQALLGQSNQVPEWMLRLLNI